MPKPASLAHELVCKLIVVILGADVIDFVYVGNCRVIKSNAALSLQFLAGVGAKRHGRKRWEWLFFPFLQRGKKGFDLVS